jgi:hypothetical protein
MLAVEIHKKSPDRRKRRHGCRAPISPRAVSSFVADVAPHCKAILLEVETRVARGSANVGVLFDLKCGLDNTAVGSGSNEITARAFTQQKGKGVDEHGLAGTGLTGEDI